MRVPTLTRSCTCCGDATHVFKAMGQFQCPVYIHKKTHRLCNYIHCRSPSLHLTSVCPWLHLTCARCGTRGHCPQSSDCDNWDEQTWTNRRDTWEEAANQGIHTKHRRADWRLGFYSHKIFTLWPFPYSSYREMIGLPVLTVLYDLRRYTRAGVWPRSSRLPKPDGFPFPDADVIPHAAAQQPSRRTKRGAPPRASARALRNRHPTGNTHGDTSGPRTSSPSHAAAPPLQVSNNDTLLLAVDSGDEL